MSSTNVAGKLTLTVRRRTLREVPMIHEKTTEGEKQQKKDNFKKANRVYNKSGKITKAKMDSASRDETVSYMALDSQCDSDSPSDSSPSRTPEKYYEMALINGEKSHLLIEDTLGLDDMSVDIKVQHEETFLSIFSSVFIPFLIAEHHHWLAPTILAMYLASTPVWIYLTSKHKQTREVLFTGWTPVLAAMVISSLGGLILDCTVKNFKGIAVFQPVINGAGGKLVAVQASRISTSLHFESQLGILPPGMKKICSSPISVFFSDGAHAKTARALLLMVVPGHLIFCYAINYVKAGHTSITLVFLVFYLLAAHIQVILLLLIAEVLIKYLWYKKTDPDNSAIPYLTALGDLFGHLLLAAAFLILYSIGDKDADVGD